MLAPLILHLDRQSILRCRGEETRPGKESVPFKKRDDSESYVVTPKKVLYALKAGFISVLASHPHPVVCFSSPEFLVVNLKRSSSTPHTSLFNFIVDRRNRTGGDNISSHLRFFFPASTSDSVSSLSASHSFHGCKE